MSELFSHMLQRHQGIVPIVKPRRLSRFETTQPAFTAAASPLNGEERRPMETVEQQSRTQAASAPAPAAPSFGEDPGEVRLAVPPATTGKLRNPPEERTPRLHPAAVAPQPQPKPAAPETASPKDAPLPQIDQGNQRRPRRQSDTFLRPAPMAVEISRRFSTLIARHAERPHEQQVRSVAADGRLQDATGSPVLPDSPENVIAPSAAERPEFHSPPQRREQLVETVKPDTIMTPIRNTPPAPASTDLSPKISAGEYAAILGREPSSPVEEDGSRVRDHMLVPPDWLARMRFDFQRGWDSMDHNSKAEPTINVTIGRVEVRAEAPAAPPKPRAKEKAVAVMSLEEYLSQRKGRR